MIDALDIKGRLTLRLHNAEGALVEETTANNAIMLSGRDLVAKLFLGEVAKPAFHIAVGSNSNPINVENTKLGDEKFRKAVRAVVLANDLTVVGTGDDRRSRLVLSADLDFNEPPAAAALTEAGIFTGADVNNSVMYNRVVFAPVNKTSAFKLTLVWELLF